MSGVSASRGGGRHVSIREHRPKEDFAFVLKELLDEPFPEAQGLRVVMDNLNTHTPASFYEVFPPEDARRLASKLEIHDAPKQGSWLDMAEVELSVFTGQGVDRRIPTVEQCAKEVTAWEQERNHKKATVAWRFTSQKARKKLTR